MEKLLKINYWKFIPLLILSGLLSTCADDPNSVGNALIPEKDKLSTVLIDSYNGSFEQSFESFQKDSLYFGSSPIFLLGNFENISSEALLEFLILIPDSIKEGLENNTVNYKSSWMELYPAYWFGDNSNFKFSVHEINRSWNSLGLNEDSVNAIRSDLGTDILEEYTYETGDSVIKFSIDDNLVVDWITKSIDDTYIDSYGILLDPMNSNGMAGFQGISNFPKYNYPALFMIFEKEGEFIDTVISFPKIDIHLPEGERLDDPLNGVLLQSGINVRGKLKFNFDTVPRNIIVNKAILDLFIDDANSFGGTVETDTVAISYFSDYEKSTIIPANGKYPILKNNGKYTGDIRQFVQRWLNDEVNEGIEIKLSDENRSAAAVSFYGSDHPNESLRPRLTIYYTKK